MSLSFNRIFTSSAVFAHGRPIYVYGTGTGGVSVNFAGVVRNTEANDGKWLVTFPPMESGGPYTLSAFSRGDRITLDDIYVGEVILLMGQSNMQMKLHETDFSPRSYKSCEKLRLFSVDRVEEGEYFHESDGWVKCDKRTAGNWSALGYHIGSIVASESGASVGMIACYQGASVIQSWLPSEVAGSKEFFVEADKKHPDHRDYPKWNSEGFLYENMLCRIIPFAINRVIFYQGESNTSVSEAAIYDKLLLALINSLRKDFKDVNLPVTVVQIADLEGRGDGWTNLQHAQLSVTHMTDEVRTVISADICENNMIHPVSKFPLANRIVDSFVRTQNTYTLPREKKK